MPLILGFALLSGCGKKGALVPPEALAPAPVSDLAIAQKGARFEVTWSAPSREEGGAPLRDLAGFLLFRRTLLPPAEDCEECPGAYSQLARIDLDFPQGVRRIGNRLLVDDYTPKKGKSYQYKVRAFTTGGARSRDSNLARRAAVTPPLPPVVEALSSATGVVLAFVAPPPEEGSLIGYNIYRSRLSASAEATADTSSSAKATADTSSSAEATADLTLSPLNAAPVTGTTYEDKEILVGERYSYTVTSLAAVNGETVQSAPSNPAEGGILERD
ncbi:MAG: hypothetical protein A2075_21195 [Geobacteraceae bacterium GWC2_58_44]|nr:MAG: hypothetical protein A2075_21195 [Geobacteraceae bacterium GWC2_58_44]HBG04568.1 hypothetical protein [Geobacter sp.]